MGIIGEEGRRLSRGRLLSVSCEAVADLKGKVCASRR
jgi:hypothetical protein